MPEPEENVGQEPKKIKFLGQEFDSIEEAEEILGKEIGDMRNGYGTIKKENENLKNEIGNAVKRVNNTQEDIDIEDLDITDPDFNRKYKANFLKLRNETKESLADMQIELEKKYRINSNMASAETGIIELKAKYGNDLGIEDEAIKRTMVQFNMPLMKKHLSEFIPDAEKLSPIELAYLTCLSAKGKININGKKMPHLEGSSVSSKGLSPFEQMLSKKDPTTQETIRNAIKTQGISEEKAVQMFKDE